MTMCVTRMASMWLFVHALLASFPLVRLLNSREFTAKTSPISGQELCANETPSAVIPMSRGSILSCGNQCDPNTNCCRVYQHNKPKGQCQLFFYLPESWVVSDGCKAFVYRAIDGVEIPNVTIPSVPSKVPLRSVAGWLAILSRIDSNFPMGQSNSAYTNGFGNINSNFWLGVEKVYQLTNGATNGGKTYRLRFELFDGGRNHWYMVEYDWFYLDSSTNSYTFRTTTASCGNAIDAINYGDSLTNGSPFRMSTSVYCVTIYGPWWYVRVNSCAFATLFGSPMQWYGMSDFTAARMMVRPYDV